jgi:predicted transcriptional regulator of viral defense system
VTTLSVITIPLVTLLLSNHLPSMRAIELLRNSTTRDYVSLAHLIAIFGSGDSLKGKVKRMIQAGELINLKRGHYVFGEQYRRGLLEQFHLGNVLYGPSYISLESALSHWSLIPERVYTITSVCTKRPQIVTTTLGRYRYRKIPLSAFSYGLVRTEQSPHYLIASPEKALLDKLYLDGIKGELANYLVESLRIEPPFSEHFDKKKLVEYATCYNQKKLAQCVCDLEMD